MTKWIIAAAALALAANAAVFAQSGRNKGSMSDSMSNRPTVEAPVGHRQQRTSDVPDEKNLSSSSDPMTKDDAALDRKIKSICRGC